MDKIEELLTRGVANIIPSKEDLERVLRSGKKLRLYQGFDPTSPELHLGHLVGLKKLRQWQDLGHEVIFLIGDFTGMVGDPTGKDKTRIPLTKEQVLENARTYKQQASKVLRFEGENPVLIKYNSEWLAKLSAVELTRLTSYLTFQQVVERDMFQRRIEKGQDISISEFLYPFMQGYDSVAMDVDLELGGNDQLFNMMTGRDLMRKMKHKDKYVMTTPLLVDSEGRKIGKTEGNLISLINKSEDFFGKIMALGDDILENGFEYLTSVSIKEIKKIKEDLANTEDPLKIKKNLAFEITKEIHGEREAVKAQEHFERTVQKKEKPQVIRLQILPSSFSSNATASEVVMSLNSSSRSEAKRIIEQGGITIDDEIVNDPNKIFDLTSEHLLKVGKRNFIKFKKK